MDLRVLSGCSSVQARWRSLSYTLFRLFSGFLVMDALRALQYCIAKFIFAAGNPDFVRIVSRDWLLTDAEGCDHTIGSFETLSSLAFNFTVM